MCEGIRERLEEDVNGKLMNVHANKSTCNAFQVNTPAPHPIET